MTVLTDLMLSRAEAAAVAYALNGLDDLQYLVAGLTAPESSMEDTYRRIVDGLTALARHFELEMTIRAGGGWWNRDSPAWLDLHARYDEDAECPDEFVLAGDAVPALIELLPWVLAEVRSLAPDDDEHLTDRAMYVERVEALQELAGRLDVKLGDQ